MLFGSLEQPIIQSDTITRGCFMKLTVTRFYFLPILIDGRRWNRVATNFTVPNCFTPRLLYITWEKEGSDDGFFFYSHYSCVLSSSSLARRDLSLLHLDSWRGRYDDR